MKWICLVFHPWNESLHPCYLFLNITLRLSRKSYPEKILTHHYREDISVHRLIIIIVEGILYINSSSSLWRHSVCWLTTIIVKTFPMLTYDHYDDILYFNSSSSWRHSVHRHIVNSSTSWRHLDIDSSSSLSWRHFISWLIIIIVKTFCA